MATCYHKPAWRQPFMARVRPVIMILVAHWYTRRAAIQCGVQATLAARSVVSDPTILPTPGHDLVTALTGSELLPACARALNPALFVFAGGQSCRQQRPCRRPILMLATLGPHVHDQPRWHMAKPHG